MINLSSTYYLALLIPSFFTFISFFIMYICTKKVFIPICLSAPVFILSFIVCVGALNEGIYMVEIPTYRGTDTFYTNHIKYLEDGNIHFESTKDNACIVTENKKYKVTKRIKDETDLPYKVYRNN